MFTIDTTGDGKGDAIQIKVINLLLPFVVPENIEIGDFDLKSFDLEKFNFSEYVKLSIDDKPINISKKSINFETIKDRILIYHKGESFKLDDILEGKIGGRTIELGDSISILIKLDQEALNILTEGEHFFKIESDLVSNFTINFELDETNMNLKFDPQKT
ncbi:MAG: hypothetical protein ACFE94_02070 [Candidatus Hodarchaeota archaeon]